MKKETKKDIGEYAMSSVMLLGVSLMFSLLSLIFLIDKIPNALKFVFSVVFAAPVFLSAFARGRNCGEKLFKRHAKTTLDNLHNEEALHIPYYKCIYHVIGYVVPLTVVFIIAICMRSTVVRMVGLIFIFPVMLFCHSLHLLDMSIVQPFSLAIFLGYIVLLAGTFVAGYLVKIYRLKRRHGEIENEIRMYDN